MAETIMSIVTMLVTYIFAEISKKFNLTDTNYIPIQNLVIGVIAGLTIWAMSIMDNVIISVVICTLSAFGAGGIYDLVKKLNLKIKGDNNETIE